MRTIYELRALDGLSGYPYPSVPILAGLRPQGYRITLPRVVRVPGRLDRYVNGTR
jgi:hypothetical protein